MGRRAKIIQNSRGVDYINWDVDRGARGTINTPCFYLDRLPFEAPTFWLVLKYPKSKGTRQTAAKALKRFLNAFLDGMDDDAREKADFHFWKQITREDVEGYFYTVLYEDAGQASTSIKITRALIQSFYSKAAERGWCTDDLSLLFNGLEIEKDTQLDLHSQYLEAGLYEVLIKQIESWHPEKKTEKAGDRLYNERKRFLQSRDRLVMDLGYEGGLRTNEVSQINVEKILTALEAVEENNRITRHITIEIIRKGGNVKRLEISQHLGQQIYNFIRHERKTRLNKVAKAHSTDRTGPLICSEAGKSLAGGHGTHVFAQLRKRALVEDIPALLSQVEEKETPGHWLAEHQIAGNGKPKSALSFHALRHTYLTNLSIENPGEDDYIRQQAGHADKSTTFNIYVDFGAKLEKLRSKQSAGEAISHV